MRLIGDYIAKTDAKGRVFLPAGLRKQLGCDEGTRLILRPDLFQPCLVLYTEALWNEMLDEMRMHLNRYNAGHQAILRQFVADAEMIELDSNGRFLMNKRKLQHAGITQEVRFLAVDDHIEVWDKVRLERNLEEANTLGERLQEVMGNFTNQSQN